MVTVAQSPTPHKSHRWAYGAHRQTTPQQRAQDVAASIRRCQAEGRPWTWADYGLDAHRDQQALVLAALGEGR
jgi:hypothetical protein